MAALPLTLMGAGPHPTRPRRLLWGEKNSTAKLKDENEETHGFQNSVAQVGPEPEPAEVNTESTVRQAWFDSFCWLFCSAESSAGLFAPTLRKYLFISR